MLNFLKSVVANFFALLLFFGLLVVLGVMAVAGLMALSLPKGGAEEFQKCKGVLVLDLSVSVAETVPETGPFDKLLGKPDSIEIFELLRRLYDASNDPNVGGMLIWGSTDTEGCETSIAASTELRRAVKAFKDAGKPVFAYLENPGLKDYYIASSATEIMLNPASDFEFKGIAANAVFFGNALKKYGIGVQVVKCGKYKNFGDMFTRADMPDEDKAHLSALVGELWTDIKEKISRSRLIAVKDLDAVAEKRGLLTAKEALDARMVDLLCYKDEVIARLSERFGYDEEILSFRQFSVLDYTTARNGEDQAKDRPKGVAIVYLTGEIVETSQGDAELIAADYVSGLLRDLRGDDTVGSVILRIDSPGGSAYASEVIRREVQLLSAAKPVVVSFGSTGASGAYWIASPARTIFCEEESIVGSIGVFGILFDAKKLGEDFGVTFDGVQTDPYSDIYSVTHLKTPAEISRVQNLVDNIYEEFIRVVSEGRNIPADEVRKLANGRVYAGQTAKKLGLVNEIGGLGAALSAARTLGEMPERTNVYSYPEERTFEERLAEAFTQYSFPFAQYAGLSKALNEPYSVLTQRLTRLSAQNGVCARMPYALDIK